MKSLRPGFLLVGRGHDPIAVGILAPGPPAKAAFKWLREGKEWHEMRKRGWSMTNAIVRSIDDITPRLATLNLDGRSLSCDIERTTRQICYSDGRVIDLPMVVYTVDDLGARDNKGRIIGYRVRIYLKVHSDGSELYHVEPHALRNGRTFGALPVRAYRALSDLQGAFNLAKDMIEGAARRARKATTK